MDVTVVLKLLELYGPWTTLFTPCVDLGFPKKQDFVLKKIYIYIKYKKKVKVTPLKKEVKEKKRKEKLKKKR